MALIQISNQSTKQLGKKSTIRFTQSICPDCNMILDAEVFERDDKVYMTKTCPTHGECEELYFGSFELYQKFSTYWQDGKGAHAPNVMIDKCSCPTKYFAKSPSTGLETTKQKMESDFIENQNIIVNELVPLYEKSGTSERPDIWVLSGTVNIAAKILEMVETCRNEVMIAVPEAGEELVKQALPKLRSLHDKGVGITVLTSDKMSKESLKAISRVADVKVKKGLFGGGIISDKRYVVIFYKI